MSLVGHGDGHAVESLADGHAGQDAHVVAIARARLNDVVDVGAWLGIGDDAEVEAHTPAFGSALGLTQLKRELIVLGALGHGSAVDARKHEGELVLRGPGATPDGLLTTEGGVIGELSGGPVGVGKRSCALLASYDGAGSTLGGSGPTRERGLGDLILPAGRQARDGELLATLELMRVRAVVVKGNREVRIALDLAGGVGHGAGHGLVLSLGNAHGEVEILASVDCRVKALGNHDGLGDLKGTRLGQAELAVVARPDEDLVAGPLGVDEALGGLSCVAALVVKELVDVGHAGRSLGELRMAITRVADVAVDVLHGTGVKAHIAAGLGGGGATDVPERALIVVGLAFYQRIRRRLGQSLILVDGRVAGDVVVAVLLRRGEGCRGVAIGLAGPGVGQEVDLAVSISVTRDVIGHLVVRIG